ncbi:MAG: M50 family metallopeptidase [Candidatus Woesearchaeota archaeon]|nr:MAG: M50 family metallopeptidase [Candidatus Woesearchaeota archaeon]
MALFTFGEIISLIITALVVAYIFTGIYRPRIVSIEDYYKRSRWKVDKEDFLFALYVAGPAVILHELLHKFVALAFGLNAQFFISPFGLGLGLLLKIIGSPFIIVAPGYVGISSLGNPLHTFLIALAGPLTNAVLWLIAYLVLKNKQVMPRKEAIFWNLTKIVNQWLFIFNMIPIPPLDGSKVLLGLIGLF